jgi:hypothetical protein
MGLAGADHFGDFVRMLECGAVKFDSLYFCFRPFFTRDFRYLTGGEFGELSGFSSKKPAISACTQMNWPLEQKMCF